MSVESAEDLEALFSAEDFGSPAVVTVFPAGISCAVTGIFSDAHSAAGEAATGGVSTLAPVFSLPAHCLPAGASQGDQLTLGAPAQAAGVYRIADIRSDGSGLTRLILERVT